jgi:hypothetical protein
MIVCFAAINVSASPVEMGKVTVTVMGTVHLVAVHVSSNATRDEVWRLSNILFLSGSGISHIKLFFSENLKDVTVLCN